MLVIARYIIAAPLGVFGLFLLIQNLGIVIDAVGGKFGASSINETTFLMLPGGYVIDGKWIWLFGLAHAVLGLIFIALSIFIISFQNKK